MIDVKQAIGDVWSITFSFRHPETVAALGGRRAYKRFLIAADNGEFVAMKVREVAMS